MTTLALMGGILAAYFAARWCLQAWGALALDWADVAGEEVPPPADHPYAPNGGRRIDEPLFPESHSAFDAHYWRTQPQVNAALPGRRKDNDAPRDTDTRAAATN
jgi:hypothetical protein